MGAGGVGACGMVGATGARGGSPPFAEVSEGIATLGVGSGVRLVAGVTEEAIDGEAAKGVERTDGGMSATRSGLTGCGVGAATG